ncbi:hypothetical protein K1719_003935 [Acacia pycnantha]|nr:hypothetical protein K1719_003935 [Acacia pycnantha]
MCDKFLTSYLAAVLMVDKGKGVAGSEEDTGPVLRGNDEVGQGENELDGDYIEELGELDDVGDLNDIGSLEDPPLNQNVGETGADDSDIDDDSFMGESLSESSEREDSLDDDCEIHEDTEVIDEEEDNLDYGDPVEERLRLSQLDGSERRPYFTVMFLLSWILITPTGREFVTGSYDRKKIDQRDFCNKRLASFAIAPPCGTSSLIMPGRAELINYATPPLSLRYSLHLHSQNQVL